MMMVVIVIVSIVLSLDKREFDIWVTALKELLEGVDSRRK